MYCQDPQARFHPAPAGISALAMSSSSDSDEPAGLLCTFQGTSFPDSVHFKPHSSLRILLLQAGGYTSDVMSWACLLSFHIREFQADITFVSETRLCGPLQHSSVCNTLAKHGLRAFVSRGPSGFLPRGNFASLDRSAHIIESTVAFRRVEKPVKMVMGILIV